jgi:hypothetical protein
MVIVQQHLNLRDLLTNMCRGEALWDQHKSLLSPTTELANKAMQAMRKEGLGKDECEKKPRRKLEAKTRGRLPRSRAPCRQSRSKVYEGSYFSHTSTWKQHPSNRYSDIDDAVTDPAGQDQLNDGIGRTVYQIIFPCVCRYLLVPQVGG